MKYRADDATYGMGVAEQEGRRRDDNFWKILASFLLSLLYDDGYNITNSEKKVGTVTLRSPASRRS